MRKLLYTFLAIFALGFVVTSQVYAKTDKQEIISLSKNEVVDHDYFAAGDIVEISGTVNGDVYAAGGQVFVDGTINGDLLAAGGMVTVTGKVSQNIRVAGGQVNVNGEVGRNLTLVGGNIDIGSGTIVVGNLVAAGGNVTISAPIGGDIKLGAGNVTIANSVGGNVEAGVGQMRLTSGAMVGGNVTYYSDEDASISSDASISGMVDKKTMPVKAPEFSEKDVQKVFDGIGVFAKLTSAFSTLIIGLLFVYLFPNYTKKVVETISSRPIAASFLGFTVLILAPVAILILFVTLLGIPLAMIGLFSYLTFLYVARIFVIFWVGEKVFELAKKKARYGWVFVVGLVVYYFVTMLPVIGGLIVFVSTLVGWGAMLITCRATSLKAREKAII